MRLDEIQVTLKSEIETFPFMRKKFIYNSSPLNFQKKSGIKVCQYYKIPDNLPVEEVYRYYSSILGAIDRRKIKTAEYRQRMQYLTDSIINMNPDLVSIVNTSSYPDPGTHVLTAALSLFPLDDIRSFVVDEKTYQWYRDNDPTYCDRMKKIEDLTGALITWVMSEKTISRVYSEVCKKYKK